MNLKRRIGVMAVAVVVMSTTVMAPAYAGVAKRVAKGCERDYERQRNQIQCCKNRLNNDAKEDRCIKLVKRWN